MTPATSPTVAELAAAIGTVKLWPAAPGVLVPVKVYDVKVSHGQIRYRVSPIGGRGLLWVETLEEGGIA